MSEIQIIPLPEKASRPGYIRMEVSIPADDQEKLIAYLYSDTWEKAQALRNAKLSECIKSLEVALNWALNHDTSGARVFATLLASMYNGTRVKFDVSDLKRLDQGNFEHAMNCIRLCQETHREPHQFFKNGNALFERFIKDWKLEKKARAA